MRVAQEGVARMKGDRRSPDEREIDVELQDIVEDLYCVANLLERIQRRALSNETAIAAQLVAGIRKKLAARR